MPSEMIHLSNGEDIRVDLIQTRDMDTSSVVSDRELYMCPYCGNKFPVDPSENINIDEETGYISHSCKSLLELSELYIKKNKTEKKLILLEKEIALKVLDVKAVQVGDCIFFK